MNNFLTNRRNLTMSPLFYKNLSLGILLLFATFVFLSPQQAFAINAFFPDFGSGESTPSYDTFSCSVSSCGGSPLLGSNCYNGPNNDNPGTCAGQSCRFGDPWSIYAADCFFYPVDGGCYYAYYDYSFFYSDADKCIGGETGLRPGYCGPGSYGANQYKACCSGASPVGCFASGNQDPYSPSEGVCPGGSIPNGDTVVSCGYDSYPSCATACAVAHPAPPPPPPPSTINVQGYKVDINGNAYDPNGSPGNTTISASGDGSSGGNSYLITPDAGTVTVFSAVPANYSVYYSLCLNCTSHPPESYVAGSSVTFSLSSGFADLWWKYVSQLVTIQGYKVVGISDTTAFINPQTVSLDFGAMTSTANYYAFSNLAGSNHNVSVTVPSGWSVGYTVCYNGDPNCHNDTDTPISGSSVNVSVPLGGWSDLWWHYNLTAQPANLRVSAGSPYCNLNSAQANVAWNAVNGALSYKVYIWNGFGWAYQGITTGTNYTLTGLSDASGYTWGVEACGGNGGTNCSGITWNDAAGFTTPTCSAPSTLNITSTPIAGVTITGGSYDGITNYSRTGSSFTGNLIAAQANDPPGYTFSSWTGSACGSIAGRFCTVNFSGSGLTRTATANYTATPTLSVNLSASPVSGTAPLTTTLSADVGGTAAGTINYGLWWDCGSSSNNVSTVSSECSSLPAPSAGSCAENSIGRKCNAVNTDPMSISHAYSNPGSYRAYVIAERGSAPAAIDWENITVSGQPDLITENLSSSPLSPVSGNSMSFSGTVRNSGGVSAGSTSSTRLRIDIDNNGTWDVTPVTNSTANLAVNGTENETWSSAWTATAGTHKFEICADSGSAIAESSEANNCTTQIFTVSTAGQPDLVTQNLSYSPANPVAGNSMSFAGDVRNAGTVSAGSISSTRLRVDIDNNGTWDITPANNSTANLAGGGIENEIWSNAWSSATAGTHKFEVCADISGVVNESSEANNCATQTFTVGVAGSPDLVVESLSFSPASPVVGSSMSFSGTVRNAGSVSAGSTSSTRLRVDIDNNGTWDINPANNSTANLTGGGTENENWSGAWPSATSGTHKFEVCADTGSAVTESNENNNCTSQTFSVGCTSTAPNTPTLSSPSNLATNVSINPTVGWNFIASWGNNCAGNNNTYTVLMDTNPAPTTSRGFVGDTVNTLGVSPSLNATTTYYWRVRANNGALSATSTTWQFKTAEICGDTQPSAPNLYSPAYDVAGVALNPTTLDWDPVSSWGTNCSGNNNTYTVYLDTNSNPSTNKGSVGQSTTSMDLNGLSPNTLYYWKVTANNGVLNRDSVIWRFTTGTLSASPSAVSLSMTEGNYCTAPLRPIFSWVFNDPDAGDTQSAYRVQVDNNSDFSFPEVDSGKVSLPSNSFAPLSGIAYGNTYYWRVQVWDSTDTPSGWTQGPEPPGDESAAGWQTPAHAYPDVSFGWSPATPVAMQVVQFTDNSVCVGSCQAWEWAFGDGGTKTIQNATYAYGLEGTYEVSLGVTDSSGYACKGSDAVINDVTIGPAQPKWKEVPPFSWIINVFAALGELFGRLI